MTAVLFGAGLTLGVSALAVVVNKALAAIDNRERKTKQEPSTSTYTEEYDNDEDFTL